MPLLPTELVVADYRKWPDGRHYRFSAVRLGEDGYGVWLGMVAGTTFTGPRDGAFTSDNVLLVPDGAWWTAKFRAATDEVPLYVDICAPPRWDGNRLVATDLDLDVIRRRDGRIVLDDEDEFERHRVELAYPEWLQEGAGRAAKEVVAAVEAGREPFGTACRTWLDRLASSGR